MRWLLLLVLVTSVWFLAHAVEGARKRMDNHRRGLPPNTKASFSIMPGMIVMPIASMSAAFVADKLAPAWGYLVVAFLHLAWGAYLISYIALVILRLRSGRDRERSSLR